MITIRKSAERGHANHGWLDTYHTFSFADYYDPQHIQFRSLRVINEDHVAGGGGFDTHPHRDMEIITYVVSGALEHRDSLGNHGVIKPGEVQRLTAGTGIQHSEFNHSATEPVHLLQIWILPDKTFLHPSYEQKAFADEPSNGRLRLVAAKDGRNGAVTINQDVNVFLGKFGPGDVATRHLKPDRHAWLQVINGDLLLNHNKLKMGDGAAVSDESSLKIVGNEKTDFLLFDLN
ncbi:MAG: pirin family protein [Verrucomicrobia bacterium]|nr:pirin family protein [Verrucomicrobiota bacterium]